MQRLCATCMKLENQLATAVCKKITEQGGMYLPPFAVKNKPVHFAQDNIDLDEATPDGTNTLHGTIIVIFQQETDQAPMSNAIQIDLKSKETVSLSDYDVPLSQLSETVLMRPSAAHFQSTIILLKTDNRKCTKHKKFNSRRRNTYVSLWVLQSYKKCKQHLMQLFFASSVFRRKTNTWYLVCAKKNTIIRKLFTIFIIIMRKISGKQFPL